MARKLNTHVHVVEVDKDGKALEGGRSQSFGPKDDLPEWAEKSISNPDVWEGSEDGSQKPVRKQTSNS